MNRNVVCGEKKDKVMDKMSLLIYLFWLQSLGVDTPPIIGSLSNGYSYNISFGIWYKIYPPSLNSIHQ